MKHYDYILVGQGIAGSVLALELISTNKTVLVIDNPQLSMSSQVAAGIWNPVVFKRLTKSWLADDVIPVLNDFYRNAELRLEGSFVEHPKIAKLFTEEQEKNFWKKKQAEDMGEYLSAKVFQMQEPVQSDAAFVLQTGNINTRVFLHKTRAYLERNDLYLNEKFDYLSLEISPDKITYKNFSADSIIFCEGHLIKDNPYFNAIPMKPAKGEVLTIRCEKLNIDYILNKGFFIMPLGNQLYKVGATYNWQDLTDTASPEGRMELEDKFKKLIPLEYEVVAHEAGVRPSVIDRRPVIGKHAKHQNLILFNGFGTKAVMLAPYFAKQLVNYLDGKENLDKEVDCNRFKKS